VFALPALAYRFLNTNAVLTFWFAYVMTRPLGASFADWLGKSRHAGGLGYGDGPVAAVLAALIALLVAYLTITGGDRQPGVARHGESFDGQGGLEPNLGKELAG
jgi:uncharacterized membrane-anchored protein